MPNPISPADRLHLETLQAIGDLTSYQAGHIWSAENDRDPKRLMAIVREWRLKQPKTLAAFAELLDALGYRLAIVKK